MKKKGNNSPTEPSKHSKQSFDMLKCLGFVGNQTREEAALQKPPTYCTGIYYGSLAKDWAS